MRDIRRAARLVMFANESEEYPYSTHGGTLFVVRYNGKFYGLTAKHVFGNNTIEKLIIWRSANPPKHSLSAAIKGMCLLSGDDEMRDLAVIEFGDVEPDHFGEDYFDLNADTVDISDVGRVLRVFGFINEKTVFDHDAKAIKLLYADMQMRDAGAASEDHFIRRALGTWATPPFKSVEGLSGAPMTNYYDGRLSGMVVRGGLKDNVGTLWFIDIFHILQALQSFDRRDEKFDYVFYPRP